MRLKNNVKGITLIALVVTIIVLLILAGVALNLTIGQNGIFTRAQDAANTWRNAESNEQLAMGELEDWMDSVSGDNNNETEPTYTNIFAQLYSNGDDTETLVFTSDDSYREEGLTYEQSYDITNEHFSVGETMHMPPWLNASANYMNSTIKTVKIVNEIKPRYTSCMFAALTTLENIEGLEKLNTKNTADMLYMFALDKSLTSLDLSIFDTRKVTNMSFMFTCCQSLTSLDLSSFDTSNVTNMSSMFGMNPGNKLESITFGDKFNTSKVTDMSLMFTNCGILKSLDLSKFDTSNVTNMSSMFDWCNALTSLELSSFDTSNVKDMSTMFRGCLNLSTIYVGPNWTTDGANTELMFNQCGTDHVTPKP